MIGYLVNWQLSTITEPYCFGTLTYYDECCSSNLDLKIDHTSMATQHTSFGTIMIEQKIRKMGYWIREEGDIRFIPINNLEDRKHI
jgi:hypothetical protein